MKIKFTLCTLAIAATHILAAQVPSTSWVHTWIETSYVDVKNIACLSTGDIITVGAWHKTIDLDPTPGVQTQKTQGTGDLFIQKYTAQGALLWTKTIACTQQLVCQALKIDGNDNIVLAGALKGVANIKTKTGNMVFSAREYNYNAWVLKLDAQGNPLWVNKASSFTENSIQAIAITAQNDIVLSGYYTGETYFGDTFSIKPQTTAGGTDAFIWKLKNGGQNLWIKTINAAKNQFAQNVLTTSTGHILVAGTYAGKVDLNPGPDSFFVQGMGYQSSYLLNLDDTGAFEWAKNYTASSDFVIEDLQLDKNNKAWVCAVHKGNGTLNTLNGNITFTNLFTNQLLLAPLDSLGNILYVKDYAINGNFGNAHMAINDNNVVIATIFNGSGLLQTADSSSAISTTGKFYDLLFIGNSIANEYSWQRTMGSGGKEYMHALATDNDGNIYASGTYEFAMDFNPTGFAINRDYKLELDEAFLMKMQACQPAHSLQKINACKPFTWIDGNNYAQSIKTEVVLQSAGGCDSLVHLDLNYLPLSVAASLAGDSLVANTNGSQIKWAQCNANWNIVNNTYSFKPTAHGSYAAIASNAYCADTSACIYYWVNGVNYTLVKGFEIYPNPSNGVVKTNGNAVAKRIWVSTINGAVLAEPLLYGHHKTINLNLPAGLYLLHIETTEGITEIQKLIIE